MSTIILRGDWDAGPHKVPTIDTPVERLFLHHTVTPEWVGVDAARRVRDIARGRRFLDISYSWLIDVEGNQIEGRGWGRQGAHTIGWNTRAHAISLVGNFHADKVPVAMLHAAADLTRRHGDLKLGPGEITHGHRDVSDTLCPGDHAYAVIGDINRLAAGDSDPDVQKGDGMLRKGDISVDVMELRQTINRFVAAGGYRPHWGAPLEWSWQYDDDVVAAVRWAKNKVGYGGRDPDGESAHPNFVAAVYAETVRLDVNAELPT